MDRPRILIACFLAFSVIALVGVVITNEFSWRSPGESVLAEREQSPDNDMMSRLEAEEATLQDVLQAQQAEKDVISQSQSQPAAEDDTHSQTTSDQPDPDTVQTLSATAVTTQSASESLKSPNWSGIVDGSVDSAPAVDQGDIVPDQTPDQSGGMPATEQQPVEQPANGAASTVNAQTTASNDSEADKQSVPAASNDSEAEKQAVPADNDSEAEKQAVPAAGNDAQADAIVPETGTQPLVSHSDKTSSGGDDVTFWGFYTEHENIFNVIWIGLGVIAAAIVVGLIHHGCTTGSNTKNRRVYH